MVNRNTALIIHEKDNVLCALNDIKKGEAVLDFRALEDIPKGHKIALLDIEKGEEVVKYGFPIGRALKPIKRGSFVHTHNLTTNLEGVLDYTYNPVTVDEDVLEYATFMGYEREDGSVGVRNEIWIINTVGCVNKTAELLARQANERFKGKVDGVFSFCHPYGCSQLGQDALVTQKILAGLVHHPNAAGVLVLGLGCENNNIDVFKKVLGNTNDKRVKFLETQKVEDEIEEGLRLINVLVEYAQTFERTECPASNLILGLKCGGSDAFSGITANPLVGKISDRLVAMGGTSVLTEVPEMFGAENILMDRCINKDVFDRLVAVVNGYKEYFLKHGQVVYENPSLGNKEGGITTLEEKSLGCVQKGGTSAVVDVLKYGDRVEKNGLNILEGPGNDMVAQTVLAASGAQIILFTTGRGTPLGAPVPTIKISTNSELYTRKRKWIDFNAGKLLESESMEDMCKELFVYILDVASGNVYTCNEKYGYREIAILKDGVTL